MYRKRNMKGGNANVRPIEYYGGDSGRYFETPSPSGTFAYGEYSPVSHGVINAEGNFAGPNIGVYNVGTGVNYSQQTGGSRQKAGCPGCGCGAHSKRSRSRKSNRRSQKKGSGRSSRRVRRRSSRRKSSRR